MDLREMFVRILEFFKQQIGGRWPEFFAQFPPPLKADLERRYGL